MTLPRALPRPPDGSAAARPQDARAARQAFLGAWLADTLELGDRLVASVEGTTGQRRAHIVVSGAVVLAGIDPGWLDWASHSGRAVHGITALLIAATGGWPLVETRIRKPLYVAVTERQLMLVQMNLSREPTRVLATVPSAAVLVTTSRRSLTVAALQDEQL